MNINNVHLMTTPITKKVQLVIVGKNNLITSSRELSESEKIDYLVLLIEDMLSKGANNITDTKTGEVWTFEKTIKNNSNDRAES